MVPLTAEQINSPPTPADRKRARRLRQDARRQNRREQRAAMATERQARQAAEVAKRRAAAVKWWREWAAAIPAADKPTNPAEGYHVWIRSNAVQAPEPKPAGPWRLAFALLCPRVAVHAAWRMAWEIGGVNAVVISGGTHPDQAAERDTLAESVGGEGGC